MRWPEASGDSCVCPKQPLGSIGWLLCHRRRCRHQVAGRSIAKGAQSSAPIVGPKLVGRTARPILGVPSICQPVPHPRALIARMCERTGLDGLVGVSCCDDVGRAPYPSYSGDWGAMDSIVRRLLYLTSFSVLRFGPPRLPWQQLTSLSVAGWGTGPCGQWRAVLCPLLPAWALESVQPACFPSPDAATADWPLSSVS